MHPILLEIGRFSLKTYGLFVATGFMVGIIFALRQGRNAGYDQQQILDLAFYIIVGAIVGSRLFYVITHLSYYKTAPLDVLKVWQGGLTFFGGFILTFFISLWYLHKHQLLLWRTFDIFAPSIAIGLFFGKIGCFFAGCCYGKPCSLTWAVTFTDPQSLARTGVPLHPVQLYTALGTLLIFFVLLFFSKRKSFDGQLALLWMFLYGGSRVVIEFFRGDPRGDLILGRYPFSQVMALVLVLCSIVLFPVLRGRKTD